MVPPLALVQSYGCPCSREVHPEGYDDMTKTNTSKHNINAPCAYLGARSVGTRASQYEDCLS